MSSHIPINKNTVREFATNFRAYQKRETIPLIAEMSNLVDGLFLLYSCFSSAKGGVTQNVRRSYVQQKGVLRFALLLIPIVGSLLVRVLNFFNPKYIETGCDDALGCEYLLKEAGSHNGDSEGEIFIKNNCYRQKLEKQLSENNGVPTEQSAVDLLNAFHKIASDVGLKMRSAVEEEEDI